MRGWRENKTPWVDKAIHQSWDDLVDISPEGALPALMPGSKTKFEEYGCGYYGCALPTEAPNVVLKLTTDASEAHFVSLVINQRIDSELIGGIVTYHAIEPLEQKYRKRPIWAIWREAAEPLGYDDVPDWIRLLPKYLLPAKEVWRYVAPGKKGWQERAEKVMLDYENGSRYHTMGRGQQYRKALRAAQNMASTEDIYHVGEALWNLMEMGVMVCDPHYGNLGRADREDEPDTLVLFDPGQVIYFDPDLQPR